MKSHLMTVVLCLTVLGIANEAQAGAFVAFSLRAAEHQLQGGLTAEEQLRRLGGITHLAGMVFDNANSDLIIVGQAVKGATAIDLDDLVTAMRAVLLHKAAPLVSIDRTEETRSTNWQKVRFEGGIEHTRLGLDMLEADVVLKKLALGLLPGSIWGVQSYAGMTAQEAESGRLKDNITSRFWFTNRSPNLACRRGVFAILALDIGVETEVLSAEVNGKGVDDVRNMRDPVGDRFASQFVLHFQDISIQHSALLRAKAILALVSLASGIDCIEGTPNLDYWLFKYPIRHVDTPIQYPLLAVDKEIGRRGMSLHVTGGLELNPIVLRLQSGEVGALKEAVLKSRPDPNSLVWTPPLEGWTIPGTEDQVLGTKSGKASKREGFTVDRVLIQSSMPVRNLSASFYNYPIIPHKPSLPMPTVVDRLPRQHISPNVGGVMLSGIAGISGSDRAQLDLSNGAFSLVVGGQNARLASESFRKFVTALWAVYFSRTDPGISIDPIAPGNKKHLVRYIGKVINTDLGRVMREADYLMKKWAVGTELPRIAGFKNPDKLALKFGGSNVGVWSRFWFLPKDMKFKRADDMLIFDDGNMTVRTEYMMSSADGQPGDPANEEFARLFTERYKAIAIEYPIYQELFEYAKLASLAKFLKESKVPLFWFLLANKDLVLTENSPGTVDAQVKPSEHFRNVTIEGGVDLSTKGQYVIDATASRALAEARRKLSPDNGALTSAVNLPKYIPGNFSFELGKESYSVVPQHSLTSGKDHRGIRYQTDIAFRGEGFELNVRSLDAAHADILRLEMAERLRPERERLKAFPGRTTKPESQTEIEKLSRDAWKASDAKAKALVDRLAGLSNHIYKTEEEFAKAVKKTIGDKETERVGRIIVQHAHFSSNLELVRYFDPARPNEKGDFGKGWNLLIPYRIRAYGKATKGFGNRVLPAKIEVENLLTGEREILTLTETTDSGYSPENLDQSQFVGLTLSADGSYTLTDRIGNEFQFNTAGFLSKMVFSEDHVINLEYLDDLTDAFDDAPYKVEPEGEETVYFRGAVVPRQILIKDLIHGRSEVLTFSDKGIICGYIPQNPKNNRYKILALLNDRSFLLIDKGDHEVAFSRSGKFVAMKPGLQKGGLVRSLSMGNHKITFGYTIDDDGDIIIASAQLAIDREYAKPMHVVRYDYDERASLSLARRTR